MAYLNHQLRAADQKAVSRCPACGQIGRTVTGQNSRLSTWVHTEYGYDDGRTKPIKYCTTLDGATVKQKENTDIEGRVDRLFEFGADARRCAECGRELRAGTEGDICSWCSDDPKDVEKEIPKGTYGEAAECCPACRSTGGNRKPCHKPDCPCHKSDCELCGPAGWPCPHKPGLKFEPWESVKRESTMKKESPVTQAFVDALVEDLDEAEEPKPLMEGGMDFYELVAGGPSEAGLQRAFRKAVQDAQWEAGHGGYTGTIAEKPGVEIRRDQVMTKQQAYAFAEKDMDNNPKWENAFAIRVVDGDFKGWLIYGIASS
jgi:hypothetical protein